MEAADDLAARVRALAERGKVDREISLALELTIREVRQVRRDHDIPAGSNIRPNGNALDVDGVTRLADLNYSDAQIAEHYGLPRARKDTVGRFRRQHGIESGCEPPRFGKAE